MLRFRPRIGNVKGKNEGVRRAAAQACAILTVAALSHSVLAGNAPAAVNSGATDLSAGASYSPVITPTAASGSDVEFTGSYSNLTFNANGTALNFGSLNDFDTAQSLIITNSSATAASISLNTLPADTLSGNASDLLYVAPSANLTLQSGTGALTLNIGTSGNIDDAGTLTLAGPVSVAANSAVTFIGAGTTTISGAMTFGTGSSLVVGSSSAGVGSVILAGTSTGAGTVTINSGSTLQVGNTTTNGSLPTGAITDNGTLTFAPNATTSVGIANSISGSGLIAISGSTATLPANISLTGTNTSFTGTYSVNSGRLTIATLANLGNPTGITINGTSAVGGELYVSGAINISTPLNISGIGALETAGNLGAIRLTGSTLSGPITLGADARITAYSNTGFLTGLISGPHALTLGGSTANTTTNGTITINNASGANTYTLGTNIINASVNANSVGALSTGPITIAANNLTTTLTMGIANSIGSSQAVNLGSTGAFTSTLALGAFNQSIGALSFGGTASASAISTITGSGTLTLNADVTYNSGATNPGPATISAPVSLAGTRQFTVAASTNSGGFDLTIAGNISGAALTKLGNGLLRLSGSNSYSGTTTVTAGTLDLFNETSLYGNAQSSWTATNISVASGATLALGVGGTGQFTSADIATLLTNIVTNGTAGIASGGAIGFDTTNATGGTFTYGNVIANPSTGTLGVNKVGAGTLILTAANTYTGVTTVTTGTLQLGDGTTLNGSVAGNIVDNTSLTFADPNTQIYSGIISGAGTLTKSGAGTLTLSSANTYTGNTNVNAGTLIVNAKSGNVYYTVAQNATLDLGYNTGGGYTSGITVNGSGLASSAGLYIKGGITYSTNSDLILQTAPTTINSYSTGTAVLTGFDVNSGPFLNSAATASGSVVSSTVSINTGTYGYTISTTAGANTATGDLTINGVISGGGGASAVVGGFTSGINKTGNGSLLLTNANTFSNGTAITSGSIILSGGVNRLPIGTTVGLGNGTGSGILALNGVAQQIAGLQVNGTGTTNAVVGYNAVLSTLTINNSAADVFTGLLGGTGSNYNNLGITKINTGTLTLSGQNTYTGPTTVNAGTLAAGIAQGVTATGGAYSAFGNNSAVTIANVATATLDISGTGFNAAIGSLTGGGTSGGAVTIGANTLTLGGDNTSAAVYAGTISGTGGGVTKVGTGTATFSGVLSYTGPTSIQAGTFALTGGAAIASPTISVTPGAVFDVSGLTSGAFTVGSPTTPQALTAGRTSSPATDIKGNLALGTGGTLIVGGANGTPATLTLNGGLTLNDGATLIYNLGGSGTPNSSDLINVSSAVSLSGTTVIQPSAIVNGTYTLISGYSGITGTPSNFSLGTAPLSSQYRGTPTATFNVGSSVTVTIGGIVGATLVWQGSTSSDWDVNTTPNWANNGNPDVFFNQDNVSFGDGLVTIGVNLPGTVYPASVVFSNNSNSYTLGGPGGIAGNTSITLNGSASVTINNANSYTGGTNLNSGTLIVGNSAALGTGPLSMAAFSSLSVVTSGVGNQINVAGQVSISLTSGVTYAGPLAGTGTIVMAGATGGLYAFSSPNNSAFAGAIQLSRGTYSFTGANANYSGTDFQIIPSTTTDTADIALFNGGGTTTIKSISAISGGQIQIAPSTLLDVSTGNITGGTTSTQNAIFAPSAGLASKMTSSSGTLTFSSAANTMVVANGLSLVDFNVLTPLAVVKSGAGTLTVASGSTYTGGTTISGGKFNVGDGTTENAAAFGTGLVTIGSATVVFQPAGSSTVYSFPNSFSLNGSTIIGQDALQHLGTGAGATFSIGASGATIQATWSGKDVFIDGLLSGTAGLTISHGPTAGSAAAVHITNPGNTYSGTVSIGAGTSAFAMTLDIDSNTALQNATIATVAGTTAPIVLLNNSAGATIAGLTGTVGVVEPVATAGTYPLTINTPVSTNFTFGGSLANNTGLLSVTKSGPGALTLTANNVYTGGTIVNGGTLTLTGATAAAGTTTVNGGMLVLNAGAVTVGILKGVATVNNGGTLKLSDTTGLIFPVAYSDTINVNGGGTLLLSGMTTQDSSSYLGTLNLSSANGIAAAVTSSDNSIMRFAYTSGNGLITSTGTVANNFGVNIVLVNGTGHSLTVTPAIGNTLNITGSIKDYSSIAGLPVNFNGAGTTTLSSTASTYTGATTVTNGILNVTGTLGGTPVTVNSNGSLTGTGTLGGATTIGSTGVISPGTTTSVGKLTISSTNSTAALSLTGGGTYLWKLGSLKDNTTGVAGTDFDQIALTGSGGKLLIGGTSQLTLSFLNGIDTPAISDTFWSAAHSWTIVAGVTGTTNSGGTITTITNASWPDGNFTTAAGTNGSEMLTFNPAVTPEPASLALCALTGTGLLLRRRRRN